MRARFPRTVMLALAASLTVSGVAVSPHAATAAALPITITMPAAGNATVSNAQYSSQDVWAGVLSGVATPPSGISPLQRLANLNPPNFRLHAGTDGGLPAEVLPFNAQYTSSDNLTVAAWDFSRLNSLIANTVGRTSGSTMVNVRYAPDNMFGGTGPLGGNGNAPGALLDQTYAAFATYMANLVRYYNTVSPPAGATPPRPAGIGPIRYWEIWNEPDFSSENPRIPPSLPAPGGITLSGVNVTGGTLTAGTTYSYRIAPLTSTNQDGPASGVVSIVLPGGSNAVHIAWNPSTNLGRISAAYTIYGRSGSPARLVVVGKDNGSGLSWTDKGTITPSGAPAADASAGGAVFSPREYRTMWDQVVSAMKAVDPTIKVVGPATTNPISLSPQSVITTVVTTRPGDSSYLDNRDYVQVLMASPTNPPDVISYHAYGGYLGNESDSVLMTAIPQIAADVTSNIIPYAGSTPIWHTEANVNAGDDSSNRPALAFGAAWLASLFTKLAPIGVSTIHQYSYSQSPTFGMITEPGSPLAGAVEGNPYLPYWAAYWIDHLIAPGAKILPVANVPAGFDVLAVANPPDFASVKVLVVNRQVPATNTSVPVLLSGASATATRVRVIDSATNLVNGPVMSSLGAVQTTSVQMNGYSVALVEFDTAAGPLVPTITGLIPVSGPTAGGTQVTITGSNFQAGAVATFGSTAATTVVNSSTSLTATTPAHAVGVVSLGVSNPGGGSASMANAYAYLNSAYSMSATSLDFGGALVGQPSQAQTVTLTSNGSAPVVITSVVPSTNDFQVSADNCSGTTLTTSGQGSSCSFSVTFQPTAAGTRPATLNIVDNAGNHQIALTGTGLNSGWETLGGILASGPGVSSWASNRLDVFIRGQDSALWHQSLSGTTWSGWQYMGGIITSDPAAVSWGPNRIDVLARGQDKALWHQSFDGTTSTWSGWQYLGGILSSGPAVSSRGPGQLDVFISGQDHQLWHQSLSNGVWSGWGPLGGIITSDPAAVSWGPNRIDVFAQGQDKALWHQSFDGTTSTWSGWDTQGGIITFSPKVTSWATGRLDVLAIGGDRQLWHKAYAGAWGGWQPFGGILTSSPGAVARSVGVIDVFGRGQDAALWHRIVSGS